ncbi:nicotinate-nucleotide adenylyltransferase [Thalassobacillus sp. CUG 92003]|uniref:nicotinate-nucleotide adenylyltransferase n=1 Tax=Thalassobacillus sp. CUG 92003 TaxID=2736641 RepID=UPI0015E7C234|nr:nicotinate-nucleotide adenylyltransferase [Thalassobacillus sp. CUG 92003]
MKRIGILGGTFDPPHMGHLIIAEEVRCAIDLDEIWFIPSHTPPHKQASTVSGADRLEMTKRAVEGNPHFRVSDIELRREGTSYTFDTIKALKQNETDAMFYFIIGGDMVEDLPNWYGIHELLELVQFVGVKRLGHELSSELPVKKVNIPFVDISSTDIRKRAISGQTFRYFVPDSVAHYIKEHGVYAGKS